MKGFFVLLIGLFVLHSGSAHAQQQQTGPASPTFTLDQCIKYALDNSISVQNSSIDQLVAAAKVKETRGIGLPQVSGTVGLVNNNTLRRFFGEKQVLEQFAQTTLPANLAPTDVVASPQFFQLKNSGDAGLNITETLSASYFVGLKAANAYKELAVKNTNQTREQVVENVSKAYYGAIINKERMNLFSSNIARVDSLLRSTSAMQQNGFAESIDVDRIQVTLNNLVTERDNFLSMELLSIELLKFQMNYPMDDPLEVTGEISQFSVMQDIESYTKDWDYRNRTDYSVLEASHALQKLNLKNTMYAWLPSLSGNANLGYYTQSNTFGGLFKTNSNIPSTDQIGPDKWYSYSTYGVTLSLPIFSGLQRTYRYQQEKLNLAKIDNNFRLLKSNANLQVKQSSVNYQNNVRTLESQKRNMDLATKVAKVTRIKYEQGVGTNIEVVTAESSLKEAQVNYYNALYNVLITQVDMNKSLGRLLPASSTN